jgi:hypothetical protein
MRMQVTSIRLAAVGAALIVAVSAAVAGCGTATTTNPVAQAAEATAAEPAAQIALTQTVTLAGSQQPVTIRGSGLVDARHGTGELRLDLSSIPGLSALPGTAVETVVYGRSGLVYLNMPALVAQLPAGKSWLEISTDQAASEAGVNLQGVSPGSSDPSQI